ncbi:hypothetical protein PI124_g10118 [Phytophthora idaei]|nr:hypothetical protein PI124_g10118 [Phytophthora idaei]
MASSLTSLPVAGALGEAAARSECSDEEEPKPGSAVRDKTSPAATAITIPGGDAPKLQTTHEQLRSRPKQGSKKTNSSSWKEPVLLDERLEFYAKTFICTHGWNFNPRGNGSRTNHTFRGLKCPARLNALLSQDDEGVYKVLTRKHTAVHNHTLGPEDVQSFIFVTYLLVVNVFVSTGGSKRKKILRYLKEASGKPILPKAVENLIAEMRRETYTSPDDDVRV